VPVLKRLFGCLLLAAATAAGAALAPVEICAPPSGVPLNDHFVQPESTRKMAALIQQIYREADPLRNPFRATDRIPLLRAQEKAQKDPARRFGIKMQMADAILQTGDTDGARRAYEENEAFLKEYNMPPNDELKVTLLTQKALCYLRAGEQANCLLNHNADSCIFPIQGGGVHQLPAGSRSASAILQELLTAYPGDLRARWLLNIAAMTLGEYPDKVPKQWVIDPKYFASAYDIKRFPDVAAATGLDLDSLAGGIVLEDFDHDGLLDLMVSSWGFTEKDQVRVFRNNGDGTFTDRTEKAGLKGLYSGLNMIHGDYNNDGFADVLILRGGWLHTEGHYPFSLLRNNGDFTFTDVTEEAGLVHFKSTQTAVWFDYNGDGFLDIFVGNESDGKDAMPCELYRNNGNGTFTEVAAQFGVDLVYFVKGVASGDYNNDGRPDLFLSTQSGTKILLRNDGPAGADHAPTAPWKFTDVTEEAGVAGETNTFPCWFFDYDNDGWLDLMVTGYSVHDSGDIAADYLGRPHLGQKSKLYHNNRDGTFTDVSRAAGVSKLLHAMGANFGDLDNDGWLDFYCGTGNPDFTMLIPNRMFRNDGKGHFQDVTTSGGFGQLQKGHGIAFGDIDNDGDQDIYSVVGGALEADHYPNQLFMNPGHGNHWLKLMLEGVKDNRVAIGARVKVVIKENGVERFIHRVVGSGGSFGSETFRQEIGLGQATSIERVEIFWPVANQTQVLTGLKPDNTYRVREDQSAAEMVALPGFALPSAPPAGGHHHHQ
jgi:hypothetical protein